MAAHSLRILMEMGGVTKLTEELRKRYIHALGYAPGMNTITFDQYDTLHAILKDEKKGAFDLQEAVMDVLACQAVMWIRLGKPRSTFDWTKAYNEKHNSGLKWSRDTHEFVQRTELNKEE